MTQCTGGRREDDAGHRGVRLLSIDYRSGSCRRKIDRKLAVRLYQFVPKRCPMELLSGASFVFNFGGQSLETQIIFSHGWSKCAWEAQRF